MEEDNTTLVKISTAHNNVQPQSVRMKKTPSGARLSSQTDEGTTCRWKDWLQGLRCEVRKKTKEQLRRQWGNGKGAGLRLMMNRFAEGDATQTQNTGKKTRERRRRFNSTVIIPTYLISGCEIFTFTCFTAGTFV